MESLENIVSAIITPRSQRPLLPSKRQSRVKSHPYTGIEHQQRKKSKHSNANVVLDQQDARIGTKKRLRRPYKRTVSGMRSVEAEATPAATATTMASEPRGRISNMRSTATGNEQYQHIDTSRQEGDQHVTESAAVTGGSGGVSWSVCVEFPYDNNSSGRSSASSGSGSSSSSSPTASDIESNNLGISMDNLIAINMQHLGDLIDVYTQGVGSSTTTAADNNMEREPSIASNPQEMTDVDISDIVGISTDQAAGSPAMAASGDKEDEDACTNSLKCCVCLDSMGGISQRKICMIVPCMHGICSECAIRVSTLSVCPQCKARMKKIKRTFL